MNNTTNEQSVTKMDLAGGLAIVVIIVMGGAYFAYGAIIGAWLGTMATITVIGAGGAVALGLAGGAGYIAINGAHGLIRLGFSAAMSKEQLEQAKAESAMKWAEVDHKRADTALVAMNAAYQFHSVNGAAILVSNGRAEILPLPINQAGAPAMLLADGGAEIAWDDSKLFGTFRQAKSPHGLIIGPRNSGKSTLLNGLMNEVFQGADITLIDPLFNKVESGWILPSGAKVTRDFIGGLTEFYGSHKKRADNATTKRDTLRKILVIDETPSLLKQLKANDKKQYDVIMAMLRAIYSQGSHTSHNVILLSQTVLSEDLDLSSNDKANFIQVCLGSLAGDYLALRRGKAGKKGLYERLGAVANEFDHYAIFEDNQGRIDVQPLADLSQFGAKRLYGLTENTLVEGESGAMVEESTEPSKPTVLEFIAMTDKEKSVIDLALQLENEGRFSIKLLHETLTGKQIGGKQSVQYKDILAKFGYLWLIEKSSTTVQ